MNTWTEEALELWQDLVAEFGATASYEAFTFQCIKNPTSSGFSMTPTAYDRGAESLVDLLRTDAITNGLYALAQQNPMTKRPIIQISGRNYQVIKMENDDDTQPSIRLRVNQLQ